MMKRGLLPLATIALLFVSAPANAQAAIKITSVGPGQNAGDLLVKGTLTVQAGWTAMSLRVLYDPAGGGVQGTKGGITIGGNWSTTITGLTSGASYDVVAEVIVQMGFQTVPILSDPTTGAAK